MKKIKARHGIVAHLPGQEEGYFGWPSVARLDDGTLVAASSGLRTRHVCPFGKTVLQVSTDEGRTWSPPHVVQKSPLDDRDAGVVSLGGRRLLLSWFTSDTRVYAKQTLPELPAAERARWERTLATWTDAMVRHHLGSFVLLSADAGRSWSHPVRVPVSAPHGPIVLADGGLMYLGRPMGADIGDPVTRTAEAWRSGDGGWTWQFRGQVPVAPGARAINNDEPHGVELPGGRLLGLIRFEFDGPKDPAASAGHEHFSLYQTESDDGGWTWSVPRALHVAGSPPHLLRHSSGTLVCVYGYRREPYGQRAMLSRDGGRSWDSDWVLRDDGPTGDLGYPCSVEMPDGSLFTVYYQQAAAGQKCSLLWSRWELPACP